MSFWRYANPAEFMRLSAPVLPALWTLTGLTLAGYQYVPTSNRETSDSATR